MSGSITSSTTASGRQSRAVRTAASPPPAARTSQPSYRSAIDSSSVSEGSSSTTRIRTGPPSGRRNGSCPRRPGPPGTSSCTTLTRGRHRLLVHTGTLHAQPERNL